MERFDPDLLDDEWPFEIDHQVGHLFKHPHLGVSDIEDIWASEPLFYPAKPPAHWLMVAEVAGRVLMVPWPLRPEVTRVGADRSAATWQPTTLRDDSGRTDDLHKHDARAGECLLRRTGQSGA